MASNPQQGILFRKINKILAEILKYEWCEGWQDFFSQICENILNNPPQSENLLDLLATILE